MSAGRARRINLHAGRRVRKWWHAACSDNEVFQEMSSTPSVTLSNFTGIDFNQILQADEAAAQIPIAALQNELVGVNTSISTLGTIGGDFSSLQSALNSLNTSLTIPPVRISVSQNAPFTAAVTGGPIN